jgi:hypothetical protein
MIDPITLGHQAAILRKQSAHLQRARSGRNVKGKAMAAHLNAAGQPKMNTGRVFAFPRGHKV